MGLGTLLKNTLLGGVTNAGAGASTVAGTANLSTLLASEQEMQNESIQFSQETNKMQQQISEESNLLGVEKTAATSLTNPH